MIEQEMSELRIQPRERQPRPPMPALWWPSERQQRPANGSGTKGRAVPKDKARKVDSLGPIRGAKARTFWSRVPYKTKCFLIAETLPRLAFGDLSDIRALMNLEYRIARANHNAAKLRTARPVTEPPTSLNEAGQTEEKRGKERARFA